MLSMRIFEAGLAGALQKELARRDRSAPDRRRPDRGEDRRLPGATLRHLTPLFQPMRRSAPVNERTAIAEPSGSSS